MCIIYNLKKMPFWEVIVCGQRWEAAPPPRSDDRAGKQALLLSLEYRRVLGGVVAVRISGRWAWAEAPGSAGGTDTQVEGDGVLLCVLLVAPGVSDERETRSRQAVRNRCSGFPFPGMPRSPLLLTPPGSPACGSTCRHLFPSH